MLELRGEKLTQKEIAQHLGCGPRTVANYWHLLPEEMQSPRYTRFYDKTLKARLLAYFDINAGKAIRMKDVARRFDCSLRVVQDTHQFWRERKKRSSAKLCLRCTFPGDEENPIGKDGICLWCWAQMQRVDLGKLVEEWGWAMVIEAFLGGKE